MSQEDLNSANNYSHTEKSTHDFNLAEETAVITSSEKENNQFCDKTVFDQNLSTERVGNKLSDQRSLQDRSERDEQSVNSGNTETVLTTNSVVSESVDRQVDPDNEADETNDVTNNNLQETGNITPSTALGNSAGIKVEGKDCGISKDEIEPTEEVTQSNSYRNSVDSTTGNEFSKQKDEIEHIAKTKAHSDNSKEEETNVILNEKEQKEPDHSNSTEESAKHDDQVTFESGEITLGAPRSISESERGQSVELIRENELQEDEKDYKDDFEEDEAILEEEKTINRIESETSDTLNQGTKNVENSIQKDGSQENLPSRNNKQDSVDQEETETTNNDIEKPDDRSNEPEYEDQVIVDGDTDIPKVVLTQSGDLSDSDTEESKRDELSEITEEKTHDIDSNKKDEGKETVTDMSISGSHKQTVDDIKDSGFIGSSTSTENQIQENQERYRADEDNDEFWDVDETDKGNKKEMKDNVIMDNESEKTHSGLENNANSSKLNSENVTEGKIPAEKKIENESAHDEKMDMEEYLTAKEETEQPKQIENTDDGNANTKENSGKTDKDNEKKSETVQPPPVPPPPEPIKQENPLEQLLMRNVEIDGSVESITELETKVTTLLQSMKEVMKYYMEQLKLQPLRDFTTDLGKFRGDFQSINDAYQRCGQLATTMNNHLKELRRATEDAKTMVYRKFQNEDLSTWIDVPPEKEAGIVSSLTNNFRAGTFF